VYNAHSGENKHAESHEASKSGEAREVLGHR